MGGCAIFHREKGFLTFLVYIKVEAVIVNDKCLSIFLHEEKKKVKTSFLSKNMKLNKHLVHKLCYSFKR